MPLQNQFMFLSQSDPNGAPEALGPLCARAQNKSRSQAQEPQGLSDSDPIPHLLGLTEFNKTWELQHELLQGKTRSSEARDIVLITEHYPVYTVGRSGHGKKYPVPVVEIERGGLVTYHNPGQLVFYPLVHLVHRKLSVGQYLRLLENAVIAMLASFSLAAHSIPGATGVWVTVENEEKKIASMGIAISHWVTYHGFAVNVNNDLVGFHQINPCGFNPKSMTNMQVLLGKKTPSLEEARAVMWLALCRQLQQHKERVG